MSADDRPIKPVSYLDLALALMVVVSIAVVVVPSDWLENSLVLEPRHYPAKILGDLYVGGTSEAIWLDKESQRWECTLRSGAQDPFCSIQLDITDEAGVGKDLSRFNKMTIWADYQGSATHLRVYLRNRHPNYYIPGNEISTKYNMIEAPVDALATGLELLMSDFTVAGWWLIGGNIPLSDSQPQFNEVAIIEMQTGSTVRSGAHAIQLKKIVWTGPMVKQSTLYKAVIITWSAAMFYILSYRLITTQRELKRQRRIQAELMQINASLSLETLRFEELAKTDLLTGLLNRVGIRDVFYRGLVDWRDKNAPFSFILIDLDNFKNINDSYGHDIGDAVLKDVAKLMRNNVRRTDALTRWGGEEFVIACPNTNLELAVQIAENLRTVFEKNLRCQGNPVTASFGVATMSEGNLDKLFKKADIALYQAKQLGRNRVCFKFSDDSISEPTLS